MLCSRVLWIWLAKGPVLQRVVIDPNQLQVCSLLSLMYIVTIDINHK